MWPATELAARPRSARLARYARTAARLGARQSTSLCARNVRKSVALRRYSTIVPGEALRAASASRNASRARAASACIFVPAEASVTLLAGRRVRGASRWAAPRCPPRRPGASGAAASGSAPGASSRLGSLSRAEKPNGRVERHRLTLQLLGQRRVRRPITDVRPVASLEELNRCPRIRVGAELAHHAA